MQREFTIYRLTRAALADSVEWVFTYTKDRLELCEHVLRCDSCKVLVAMKVREMWNMEKAA